MSKKSPHLVDKTEKDDRAVALSLRRFIVHSNTIYNNLDKIRQRLGSGDRLKETRVITHLNGMLDAADEVLLAIDSAEYTGHFVHWLRRELKRLLFLPQPLS